VVIVLLQFCSYQKINILKHFLHHAKQAKWKELLMKKTTQHAIPGTEATNHETEAVGGVLIAGFIAHFAR
jgi:hypothetical protein